MKTLLGFCFVGLLCYGQLASSFIVYRPDGIVDVAPTGHGFNVLDFNKNTITNVTRTGDGYVIFPPDGEPTFIKLTPGDEELERGNALPLLIDHDLID